MGETVFRIVGYKTRYGSELPPEWVEVCTNELDQATGAARFKRIGYPQNPKFRELGLVVLGEESLGNPGLTVLYMEVAEEFPHFVVQVRRLVDDYSSAYKLLDRLLLFGESEAAQYLASFSPRSHTKENVVLFAPGLSRTSGRSGRPTVPCPTLSFDFVAHEDYRVAIERDYAELCSVYDTGAYKSVYVLAGSIIEALLVDQLLARRSEAVAQYSVHWRDDRYAERVEEWYLKRLITVATDLGIIDRQLAWLLEHAKETRNIVHLGYQIRSGLLVDPDFALSSLTALRKLVETLSGQNSDSTQAT